MPVEPHPLAALHWFLVFLGAGLGGMCRWLLAHGINTALQLHPRWQTEWFPPLAILLVNIVGSFCIGYLAGKLDTSSAWRLFLVVGFCGGFTTFSTFALDSHHLWLHAERPLAALANILLSVCLCICAVFAGLALAGDGLSEKATTLTTENSSSTPSK